MFARRTLTLLAAALVSSCTVSDQLVHGPVTTSGSGRPDATESQPGPPGATTSSTPAAPARWSLEACPLESLLYPSANPENETNYETYLRPEGTVRGAVIALRFKGGVEPYTPEQISTGIEPVVDRWYRTVSRGTMGVELAAVPGVHDLHLDSSHYEDPDTWQALLASAIRMGDPEIDFTRFDFIVAAGFGGDDLQTSFAYTAVPGQGILADGSRQHHLVYLGSWYEGIESAAEVMIHELGHLFGLPDLYSYENRSEREAFRWAGGWDPMSAKLPGRTFMAWHQHKLGFLRPGELACLREGSQEVVLSPVGLAQARGLKAVQVMVTPSKAYVVEVRARVGLDDGVCRPGVLVYLVDATVRTGAGPIVVKGGEEVDAPYPCFALFDATLGLADGQVSVFEAPSHGLVVRVLAQVGSGYRIRVSKA